MRKGTAGSPDAPYRLALIGLLPHAYRTATGEGTRELDTMTRFPSIRASAHTNRRSAPVAVRYAWGNNPVKASLYGTSGLPAVPFRTDAW